MATIPGYVRYPKGAYRIQSREACYSAPCVRSYEVHMKGEIFYKDPHRIPYRSGIPSVQAVSCREAHVPVFGGSALCRSHSLQKRVKLFKSMQFYKLDTIVRRL